MASAHDRCIILTRAQTESWEQSETERARLIARAQRHADAHNVPWQVLDRRRVVLYTAEPQRAAGVVDMSAADIAAEKRFARERALYPYGPDLFAGDR